MLIYYLQAIARSLKFTNNQLRMQLQTERTEDKKKVYQLAAARLQAPEAASETKPDQQESDLTSKEASIHSPSPRRNGSITNFQSPVLRGNSIHTITQSASRTKLTRGNVSGSVRSPVTILPKRRAEHIPNRIRPLTGAPSDTCRSKSCLHMACNSPAHCSHCIHSDPLYRKTLCSLHPVEASAIIAAKSYNERRGHTTRYMIVNEHKPRAKLLRSATRIPCHYLLEEPAEIMKLYPHNMRRYAAHSSHYQPHSYRPHTSQHLIKEGEEGNKNTKKNMLVKARRPQSLSDLRQQAQFYIGDHVESHRTRHRVREDDEKDSGKGETDWRDFDIPSPSQASVRAVDSPFGQSSHHVQSPSRRSPARSRHLGSHLKLNLRANVETPLTESDSASVASSSDQQNSSTDQYIQVIHNKERYLSSDASQEKLANRKSKTKADLNLESNDLICSNV